VLYLIDPATLPADYAETILPLADAKAHIQELSDDFDDLISAFRDAAVDAVEQYASLKLLRREGMVARFQGFGDTMRLLVGPLGTLEVTAIAYTSAAGQPATLTAGDWRVDVDGHIRPGFNKVWPDHFGPVVVTFNAGFAAGQCPSGLIAAVRMFAAHLFLHREAVVTGTISGEIPLGFQTLAGQYRIPVI
jgi:uncharacterized phiE125 gp8 family phage protein